MRPARRDLLAGAAALLSAPRRLRAELLRAPLLLEIAMQGRGDGARVWFDPAGLRVEPGQTVRWINREAGNVHTATAYHPENDGRPLRIPAAAAPWNSDYLMPGDAFEVALTVPGVYDYFCVPHEHAGMVGRLVVGDPGAGAADAMPAGDLPAVALAGFPSVEAILRLGAVRRA